MYDFQHDETRDKRLSVFPGEKKDHDNNKRLGSEVYWCWNLASEVLIPMALGDGIL